jgi:hypothetical protein
MSFRSQERWKSLGAKSGEYRGWCGTYIEFYILSLFHVITISADGRRQAAGSSPEDDKPRRFVRSAGLSCFRTTPPCNTVFLTDIIFFFFSTLSNLLIKRRFGSRLCSRLEVRKAPALMDSSVLRIAMSELRIAELKGMYRGWCSCTMEVHAAKHRAMTPYGGVNCQPSAFLTPPLSGGEWTTSRLGR